MEWHDVRAKHLRIVHTVQHELEHCYGLGLWELYRIYSLRDASGVPPDGTELEASGSYWAERSLPLLDPLMGYGWDVRDAEQLVVYAQLCPMHSYVINQHVYRDDGRYFEDERYSQPGPDTVVRVRVQPFETVQMYRTSYDIPPRTESMPHAVHVADANGYTEFLWGGDSQLARLFKVPGRAYKWLSIFDMQAAKVLGINQVQGDFRYIAPLGI